MKKRLLCAVMALLIIMSSAACGGAPGVSAGDTDALTVVTTIFPLYDWTVNLLRGGDADVTLLMDSGVDMHSFQPSAADMVLLSTCDLFIYVGGQSDAWAEDALQEASNPDMIVLDLMDILGDRTVEEELTEGMEPDEDEDGTEYDEHVWLSLRNAALFCGAIAEALSGLDPAHAETYAANAAAYTAELSALDAAYQATVDAAASDTLLFGDRFPFRYLADDYGLRYYAAFPGCSAETEASFETIAFLAGKLDELALPAVLTIDGSDKRIAETILQASSAGTGSVLTLDSMQSVTEKDIAGGASYLGIMEQNRTVLAAALG